MIGQYDNKNVTVHATTLHPKISLVESQPNHLKRSTQPNPWTDTTQVQLWYVVS